MAKKINMLQEKIEKKEYSLAVVGMGYVGLPLALLAAEKGVKTYGLDIDQKRADMLNSGQSYVDDISNEELKSHVDADMFRAGTDPKKLAEADVVVIAVPTPLTQHKEPDLTYIKAATTTVAENISENTLVILESTTYPGTTDEVVAPLVAQKSGFEVGKNVFVAFAPERVDPGNEKFKFYQIPKVVGGLDEDQTKLAAAFYKTLFDSVVPVSHSRVAEMTKLLENIYRLVNISMINEMALLAGKMDIDIWEVVEAAKTKPYGFQAFYPGPGAGGHCIPLDPFYLSWKAKEYDFSARFITLAGDINYRMPDYALSKVAYALNLHKKPLNGSKVLLLGVAYKRDIADPRESPMLRLVELMQKKKVDLDIYDPQIKEFYLHDKEHTKVTGLSEYPEQKISEYDCIVIGTDHSNMDYEKIADSAKLVVDLRNAIKSRDRDNVFGW